MLGLETPAIPPARKHCGGRLPRRSGRFGCISPAAGQAWQFSRQMPVGPWLADFLCRELALVVELDGHSHDVAPERDARRDAWMAAHGFTVLRFANGDVHGNVEGVVTAIGQEVERLRGLREREVPTPIPSRYLAPDLIRGQAGGGSPAAGARGIGSL